MIFTIVVVCLVIAYFVSKMENFTNVTLRDPDYRSPQYVAPRRKESENNIRLDKNFFGDATVYIS